MLTYTALTTLPGKSQAEALGEALEALEPAPTGVGVFEVEDGRVKALHHPFTQPKSLDYEDIEEIESIAYDIVLNGTELGGGSIRIHKEDMQAEIFKLLGIDEEDAKQQGTEMLLEDIPKLLEDE